MLGAAPAVMILRGLASTAADMMPTRLRADHWGGPDSSLAEDDPAWRPECVVPSVLQPYVGATGSGCVDGRAAR